MDKKDLMKLLDNMGQQGEDSPQGERIILVDALNLFFRNFAVIGTLNKNGAHVGGLGGFFRSLGALIRQIEPTQVYVVFDGIGSSNNRKNIIPEYKSERNLSRITNWDAFDTQDDEEDSKVNQIVRIIQYLKTLPVKTISIDKVEADDIIAYLSNTLINKPEDKAFIVSSDKDYLQLVNENVIVWSPIVKKYYTPSLVESEFGCPAENFILYKVLMGDNSDKIPGIKGLGVKKLYKLFPELKGKKIVLDDLIRISEEKLGEHIIYARLLSDLNALKNRFKVMDLENPMIDDSDKEYIDNFVETVKPEYRPQIFLRMYEEDGLGNLIRNVDLWLRERFQHLK